METRDYYFVLGVSRTESDCGIRDAFRKLAKTCHPDITGPEGTRHFQEIMEAYCVLSDPDKRASYNRGLTGGEAGRDTDSRKSPRSAHPTSSSHSSRHFHNSLGFMSSVSHQSPVDDFFASFFSTAARNSFGGRMPRRTMDLEVILTPREAMQGGVLPLSLPVVKLCPYCMGEGYVGPRPCRHCLRDGAVQGEDTVRLRIPSGVRDGTVAEIPVGGLGVKDFILRVHIRVARMERRQDVIG